MSVSAGSQDFEGDLLLQDTFDGGNVLVSDGLFQSDRSFDTAVYLSLYGGNKSDSGKVKNNKTWWGNTLQGTGENEKLVSRFQNIIFSLPMTTKNILEAEDAARLDLKWIVDEGMADKIETSGRALSHNRFALTVHITAGGADIYTHTFAQFWEAGVYGIRK
jgi:phage gp46-like protein